MMKNKLLYEITWDDYGWIKQFRSADSQSDRGICRDLRKKVFENTVKIVKAGS